MSLIQPDNPVCVYVVRHGRTILNADGKFRGNANPPLDSVGIEQAHKISHLFEPIEICGVFCSDKHRATKTAEIIAGPKKLPINISSSLRALDVGEFSGQDRTKESEGRLQQYIDSPDTKIPGGESLNDFKARIAPCLQAAVDLYCETGAPPLIVAHSSVVHEIGEICYGDHKAVLVDPGGAIAVFSRNGKLAAQPIFKPVKSVAGSHAATIT